MPTKLSPDSFTANEPIVVEGTYSDLKVIRGRKVVQLVVEIPIEKGEEVVAKFGMPRPDQETWVAIALLREAPRAKKEMTDGERAVQKAALVCKDIVFQRWLAGRGHSVGCEADAQDALRQETRVKSRKEFGESIMARERFYRLLTTFEAETGRMAEG